jgi:hypothetical protein
MLIRPVVLTPSPSIVSLMLGGLVGGLFALGTLYGAPVAGVPPLDVLRAVGGVVTPNPDAALAIGAVGFLIGAVLVLPLVAAGMWTVLPGREGTIGGTLIKAAAIGVVYWLAGGILLGLASLIGTASGHELPGLLGMAAGLQGIILFAVASLAYGLAVASLSFMEQGISAVDTVGWPGFTHGATGPLDLGAHRSGEPIVSGYGEKPWSPQ